jgi:hypothetical protein
MQKAKLSVYGNILKQINAKIKLDLYRLELTNLKNTMICGVDVVNEGKTSLLGFSASYNQSIS